jgi:hypothetical protein
MQRNKWIKTARGPRELNRHLNKNAFARLASQAETEPAHNLPRALGPLSTEALQITSVQSRPTVDSETRRNKTGEALVPKP